MGSEMCIRDSVYTKLENDEFSSQELDAVSFVPMLNGVSAGD